MSDADSMPYERPDGEILWEPSADFISAARMTDFMRFVERRERLPIESYDDLWRWSVGNVARFWATIWDYFAVGSPQPPDSVLADPSMPGARWFIEARVNFAQRALMASADGSRAAIRARSESGPEQIVTYAELRDQVAAVAAFLRRSGIRCGDRVAAYLPNTPAAIIGFLAAASIGAIWSCCPPEMGAESVLERFRQIGPKVLFVTRVNRYAGKVHDRSDAIALLRAGLPDLSSVVCIDGDVPDDEASWEEATGETASLAFEELPFDHPLWILYTSGTTGHPKAIVHGHGGILLEALKNTLLANDRSDKDTIFWYTTTGWVLWNLLVCNLLAGATIVLYDGSPTYPDASTLWRIAAQTRATVLGCSPAYLERCMREGVTPSDAGDMSALRSISASGAPLLGHVACWVYASIGPEIWLVSGSGGTDVATSFVGASPLMPTRAGHISARLLGVDVESYDDSGSPQTDRVGELVIRQPMPSMPLFIWGDEDGSRYRDAYFSQFPGIWRHGDWIEITSVGSAIIYGRSDATLNRRGIRLGSAEMYRVVETFPEVADSVVVDLQLPGEGSYMPLFVALGADAVLDDSLRSRLKAAITERLSARFVPDAIVAVGEIPRTITGKKIEVPLKRILLGVDPSEAVAIETLANPSSVDIFVRLARLRCDSMASGSVSKNDLA